MASAQEQSTAPEHEVRASIAAALAAQGGQVVSDAPGSLIVDVGGTVGKAFLMAGFRNAMKMPMRVSVQTAGGPGGTGLGIDVGSRGTGGGFMSGGILGAVKQNKGEKAWLEITRNAIPGRVGGPPAVPQTAPPQAAPPAPAQQAPPPPPPGTPGQFSG